ncbi:hypothetical protein D3C79_944900 [compost metagenome]
MGWLVAPAGHLVEGVDLAFAAHAETADVALNGFVDREQLPLVGREHQPGGAHALDHLLRGGVDMACRAVELVAVDTLAGAIGVAAHQQCGSLGIEGQGHQASGQQARPDSLHRRLHPGHERHSYRLDDARPGHR